MKKCSTCIRTVPIALWCLLVLDVTATLAQNSSDPCLRSVYTILNDVVRNTSFTEAIQCGPTKQVGGWYRFEADGPGEVATNCPQGNECGTRNRIWINGSLPDSSDGEVSIIACIKSTLSCCSRSQHMSVKYCNGYYVYNTGHLPPCTTICLNNSVVVTTTTISSTQTTSPTTTTQTTPSTTKTTTTQTTPSTTKTTTMQTTPSTTKTTTTQTTPSTTKTTTTPTTPSTTKTSTTQTTPSTTKTTTTQTTPSTTKPTTTQTTSTTSTAKTTFETDPCVTYGNLTDRFSILNGTSNQGNAMDTYQPGWYRMPYTMAGQLTTSCPRGDQCGAGDAIWSDGNQTESTGEIVPIQLCLKTTKRCCDLAIPSRQKLCQGFLIYDLPLPRPGSKFCYDSSIAMYTTKPTTTQTTTTPSTTKPTTTQTPTTPSTTKQTTTQTTTTPSTTKQTTTQTTTTPSTTKPSTTQTTTTPSTTKPSTTQTSTTPSTTKQTTTQTTTTPSTTKPSTTQTTPTTSTAKTTIETDPCVTYGNLTDRFSILNGTSNQGYAMDTYQPGWYRMPYTMAGQLTTSCPRGGQCGAGDAIWSDGNQTESTGEIVPIQLCLKTTSGCCDLAIPSRQKLCEGFLIYDLPPPKPGSRFCFDSTTQTTTSSPSTHSTMSTFSTVTTSTIQATTPSRNHSNVSTKTSTRTSGTASTTLAANPEASASLLSTEAIVAIACSAVVVVGLIVAALMVQSKRKSESAPINNFKDTIQME